MRTGRETADPSTALRSGRDDNSVGPLTAIRLTAFGPFPCNRIVIPTGAQRSGGICGFSSSSHANSEDSESDLHLALRDKNAGAFQFDATLGKPANVLPAAPRSLKSAELSFLLSRLAQ